MRYFILPFLLLGCGESEKVDESCEQGVDCPEVCDDALDNDGDGLSDCDDDDCVDEIACDQDLDDDGYVGVEFGGDDCDDSDPAVNPGHVEICDGVDNNCDGLMDDDDPGLDLSSLLEWFRDADGDYFGVPGPSSLSCAGQTGSAPNADDCNDADALINPDAVEICNGIDDDCDGDTDDDDPDVDLTGAPTWYFDGDGDTDGDWAQPTNACDRPDGYSPLDTDCDDNDPTVNGRDLDADGQTSCAGDCDDNDAAMNTNDGDGDGYSSCALDCNDNDAAINPGAVEICNLVDDDCDGLTDDADPGVDLSGASTFYLDQDGDGDGDPGQYISACNLPNGYSLTNTDCDDGDATRSGLDVDADGTTSCAGDCDDNNPALNVDDPDLDGFSSCAGDCAPSDGLSYPGAYETPGDCVDNDCDGLTGDIGCSGCSAMATWSAEIAPDLWLCAFNNLTGKSWPETYGVCNEASGYALATVGSMTRRGLPSDPQISAAMLAAQANGHDYVTSGHPARGCSWDSVLTNYESCNGLGYVDTDELNGSGSNWQSLIDGDTSDYRTWPAANSTGAHPLASICQDSSADPAAVLFDHRWQ